MLWRCLYEALVRCVVLIFQTDSRIHSPVTTLSTLLLPVVVTGRRSTITMLNSDDAVADAVKATMRAHRGVYYIHATDIKLWDTRPQSSEPSVEDSFLHGRDISWDYEWLIPVEFSPMDREVCLLVVRDHHNCWDANVYVAKWCGNCAGMWAASTEYLMRPLFAHTILWCFSRFPKSQTSLHAAA